MNYVCRTNCSHVGTLAFFSDEKFILIALLINMVSCTTVQGVFFHENYVYILNYRQSSPVTVLNRPKGSQEVKVTRFRDNGTGWW